MFQCVLRWRARVAGLGLLLAMAALWGIACTPTDLEPAAQDVSPTISVLSPVADLTVGSGAYVQISWTDFDGSGKPQVRVFYDTDNDPTSFQTLTIIDETAAGAPDNYNWNTAGVAPGTYYVGAQISDGTNTATSYAVGRVIIVDSVSMKAMDLGQIGIGYRGCIFEGFSFAGRLGDVMTGRFDMSGPDGVPDGLGDFVLVAPQADSHYVEDPEVGEAYLLFGQGTSAGGAWYTGARFNVNSIGTHPSLPGTIIVGPAYITKSLGITAVQALADVDGDGGSELMFGTPLLINGRFDDQDYDPESQTGYVNAPFARPGVPTPPNPDQHDEYLGLVWSSGYLTILASTSPLFDPATDLGGVIHIDEIGQVNDDRGDHPRSVQGIGLRVYPWARLARWYDFLNNDLRFAAALGTEDVDGDRQPDWLVASPNAANGAGEIAISFTTLATLWTDDLPATAGCYSWPYMIQGPGGNDRIPIWPFGLSDRLRGDELNAPNGQLSNPTGLGDFNDDSLGDIAASTPAYSKGGLQPDTGAAYMVFGRAPFGDHDVGEIKSSVVLNALPGIYIEGNKAGDRFGEAMAALGRPNYGMAGYPRLRDFNADTLADWVISVPGYDREVVDDEGNVETREEAGAIVIIFGNRRKDGRFTWNQIGTEDLPGVIITGTNRGDEFGKYMAQAGDVNGDGADDLLVAAPGAENPLTGAQDAGTVYVIYGPSSGADVSAYQALQGTYDIETLLADGPIKVRAIHGASQGMRIGPVAGAGDIDSDGIEDILIGNPMASPLGRTNSGEVYVVFGSQY